MTSIKPRQTNVIVKYDGKNLDKKISAYLEKFDFTDVASGESDNINITVSNRHKKWFSSWKPSKGDTLSAKIQQKYWQNFTGKKKSITTSCGKFILDDLSYHGRPLTCTMSAVSIPAEDAFHSDEVTKTWENASIKEIARTIAEEAGISLFYDAAEIGIQEMEQNGETNCKFLYNICNDYGLAMKVYSNKICIFDEEAYEAKESVATIHEKDMINWSYNTTIAGTYTGANFSFTDPEDNSEYIVNIGAGNRIKNINVTASNLGEAEAKGIAILNNENKKATTMVVTIPADPKIFSSTVIMIKGLSKLNGRYYVEKVKHNVGGAYTMSLTLRLIQARIKTVSVEAVNAAIESAEAEGTQYTIVSGDTLWALAIKFYGSGVQYTKIYSANQEVIESKAKERGKSDSDNGHWIFPGTIITIPA
ncbi:LysM peptidoglycan-binding domain-containing protein [Lachnotalea glycerini]|uniref:LysM peptidoglycan-binding domain-containing protein n=1 Tax=Lachnotalea glycerini TaxID=1763509 RepID=A0A371J384_9FIRM|nr:LysM peptidoglycan-binding domain-containing protein [Lachnotalea glycerini]RDY27136.1 LysM peptidoglycan-binding domain-containing protein [Lachnotalea glycerini]